MIHAFRRRWQSIDSKLPLIATGLVVLTVLVLAVTAHVLLERVLIESAKPRLLSSANVVAAMVNTPGGRPDDAATLQEHATLRAFVRGAATREQAIAVLSRPITPSDTLKAYAALLDTAGNVLAEYRRSPATPLPLWPRRAIARGEIGDSTVLGPFEDMNGPAMPMARALHQTALPGSRVIGYVVDVRHLSGRGAARYRQIIGRDVELLIGQPGEGVWTDFERVVAAPPGETSGDSVVTFAGGIGAYGSVTGTKWKVWVSQSHRAVIAPSRTLLLSLIPVGLGIALLSAMLMWRFTRSITRPIVQLTDAAENIAKDSGERALQPTVLKPITTNELARLRYAFERMAMRVAERQTLEMQLRHAQKMEAVGRLAGGVAHDFNNLLTAIRSYADLLIADTPEWDAKRADLMEIRKATERAAALTAQLLAYSRKQMLQPRVLDTAHVVADLEAMLKRILSEDTTLAVEVAPDVWPVKVDRGQLEQVIVNLAVNARDAMPNGGVIQLRALNDTLEHPIATRHGEVPAGQFVRISVSDTGIGMDARTQSQVFEPFFTTKSIGHGTGLGLATVHGIVAQSGGYVTVQSELRKGTTFTVYLPREKQSPRISEAQPAPTPHPPARRTETILLVEDEQVVRALARRVLERAGFRILESDSPSAAILVAGKHAEEIDLVLSDVVMPEMNGPALVAKLVAICPRARVLFTSGYNSDDVIARGLAEPGLMLLQKPFSAHELVERVRQALDQRPAGASAA